MTASERVELLRVLVMLMKEYPGPMPQDIFNDINAVILNQLKFLK